MSQEGEAPIADDDRVEPLNARQGVVYRTQLSQFAEYLRSEGKEPKKGIGYAEDSVEVRISRYQRMIEWIWDIEEITTEITVEHADLIVEALATDALRTVDGERFAEGSKRKCNDVLRNWFEHRGVDWEPDVTFSDESTSDHADPFTKQELHELWQTALEYKSIPTYNNLSPDERDRWKAHIAQEIGKPKEEVRPADWDAINKCWKIPSLIRTTREAGWRPAMVGRLQVDWYDANAQVIRIPKNQAVKNDAAWEQELSPEAALAVDRWLPQRANMDKYEGRPEMWLNRAGNPYDSGSLNNLLRKLMDEAGIQPRGRKLVWYSFRHSIGTYIYEEYTDLRIVAEVLRQKSTASADRYVHPTAELRRDAASIM